MNLSLANKITNLNYIVKEIFLREFIGLQIAISRSDLFLSDVRLLSLSTVCGKPQERVSPILVTLSSRSDSNFERLNISLKENKRDGVDPNSNGLEYCVRKKESKVFGRLSS